MSNVNVSVIHTCFLLIFDDNCTTKKNCSFSIFNHYSVIAFEILFLSFKFRQNDARAQKINDDNYLQPLLSTFLFLFASYGIPMCASADASYLKAFMFSKF